MRFLLLGNLFFATSVCSLVPCYFGFPFGFLRMSSSSPSLASSEDTEDDAGFDGFARGKAPPGGSVMGVVSWVSTLDPNTKTKKVGSWGVFRRFSVPSR